MKEDKIKEAIHEYQHGLLSPAYFRERINEIFDESTTRPCCGSKVDKESIFMIDIYTFMCELSGLDRMTVKRKFLKWVYTPKPKAT